MLSGKLRSHFKDRRLCGLRPCRRTEDGACRMWAHSRRRFVEAIKLNPQDVASTRIVAQMAKLFAIDAQARDENMNFAARHALRMERAPSVLSELKAQIAAASPPARPSTPLANPPSSTLRLS